MRIFSRVQRSHACKGETHFYPCKGEPTDFHACKGEPASFYACKGEPANFHACKGRVQTSRAKVLLTPLTYAELLELDPYHKFFSTFQVS